MWSIFQLFSGFAAQAMVSNLNTFLLTSEENAKLFHHFNQPVIMISLFIVTFIGMNSFGNIFLS
jgi:hypothetical protein